MSRFWSFCDALCPFQYVVFFPRKILLNYDFFIFTFCSCLFLSISFINLFIFVLFFMFLLYIFTLSVLLLFIFEVIFFFYFLFFSWVLSPYISFSNCGLCFSFIFSLIFLISFTRLWNIRLWFSLFSWACAFWHNFIISREVIQLLFSFFLTVFLHEVDYDFCCSFFCKIGFPEF